MNLSFEGLLALIGVLWIFASASLHYQASKNGLKYTFLGFLVAAPFSIPSVIYRQIEFKYNLKLIREADSK